MKPFQINSTNALKIEIGMVKRNNLSDGTNYSVVIIYSVHNVENSVTRPNVIPISKITAQDMDISEA